MTTSTHTPTAAGFYLRYLLDVCAGLGLDLAHEAVALGVDLQALSEPDERVSLDVVDQILTLALQSAAKLPSPHGSSGPLSLQLGAAVTPVALDVLAYASMSSRTLGDAIALLCQFEPYRLGFAQCVVVAGESSTRVELQTQGHWPTLPMQVETAIAGWIEFGRWITGPTTRPDCIEFMHRAEMEVAAYERCFACPVLFERQRNAVHIPTSLLAHPLAASNPDVCRLMRDQLQRRLDRYAKGEQFLVRLSAAIETCLRDGPLTLDKVASRLAIEPRQLRAQAEAAGTTLKAELDTVRQGLAQHYLSSGMPLADISERLGYSEQSAFSRACVRWFGVSPGRWQPDSSVNAPVNASDQRATSSIRTSDAP